MKAIVGQVAGQLMTAAQLEALYEKLPPSAYDMADRMMEARDKQGERNDG